MLFISLSKVQRKIVENIRDRRLQMELTQEGLSERSGVPLSTLRKFEQKGVISLDEMIEALKPKQQHFKSIDEVLKSEEKNSRKRGSRK